MGHTFYEIAGILIDEHTKSLWILVEVLAPLDMHIDPNLHIPRCLHGGVIEHPTGFGFSDEPPRPNPLDIARLIAKQCGIDGCRSALL